MTYDKHCTANFLSCEMLCRGKVRLVLTTIIITVQITTLHCVPNVLGKDALNLETRGNKIPFGNTNNAKKYQNTSPKTSMFQAYNFPETEFPHESSRDPLYSGKTFNANPFNAKGLSSSRSKACNDLKKDMRMKRKLDRIHENHKTNMPYFSSDPVINTLTDTDMFPEVKYPLNAMDTWEPNYWNPSLFNPKEEQYVPPDFPIFNSKMPDSKKAGKPYKKQIKSKAKQFMEDIDMFNEKMRSSRSQSKKNMGPNIEKDLADIYSKNSESFKQPESNDINVLRMDAEIMSNKTTEVNHDAITYQRLSNTGTTESRELINSSVSQVNSTITNSSLFLTPNKECINLDAIPIPIPYKVLEKSNFNSDLNSTTVKDLDMNLLTDAKNDYISNGPLLLQTDDVDKDIRRIILNTTNSSQQQPGNIASITDSTVCPPAKNNNTIFTVPNDDPLNVKIPLAVCDKKSALGSMKKSSQLSRPIERTLANIIVIPISNSMNKKKIQIVESNTGSPIVVFLPDTDIDTKSTITSGDTETVSNNAFSNLTKTTDVHEPLQINMTDLLDIISEMTENPSASAVLDIPCTTVPDTKLSLKDFEMLPNNSMCQVLPNEVNITNNATESSNEILSNIPIYIENLQNYTFLGLIKNNVSVPNIDSIDTVDTRDNTSLSEFEPTAYVHNDTGKTAGLLVVRQLIDLLLKDLVQKDPFMLVDKILTEKSINITNFEVLPISKDKEFKDTIMPNDNMTIFVNVLQQNETTNNKKGISVLRQIEDSSLREAIRDDIFSQFESLPNFDKLTDPQLTDDIEHNKSLPLYMKAPDNLLTDKASLDPSLTSNDNEFLDVLPMYETLMSSHPSDTTGGDMEFPLSMTDRFITPLTSSDNESLDSLPDYAVLQDTPLNDSTVDDNIPLPMPIKLLNGSPLVSSDNKSLHSLPDYEELTDDILSDNISDDIHISTSRELSDGLLTDAIFSDISSRSNSDTKGLDTSLPSSANLTYGVVNTTLTSDSTESLELLPNYISSSMELPVRLLTNEAFNDSALIPNHIESVELPVNEVLTEKLVNDTLENDISLQLSTKLPDRIIDTPLTTSKIGSLESLLDYEEPTGIPFSASIEDYSSLSSSIEPPYSLLNRKTFLDTSSSNSDSLEELPIYEILTGSPLYDDVSLPWSMELPDRFADTPLTSYDIESLESLTDDEEPVGTPFIGDVEDHTSLPKELQDSLLVEDNAFNDSLLFSNDNKNFESLQLNQALSTNPLNDNWDDMLPIQLPENNDGTIQELHSTDILQAGVFMDTMGPDIFTENDKRLLARNTLPDYIEEDKVLPANKVTNDIDRKPIPVDKNCANKKLIANEIPQSEAVNGLINEQLSEISASGKPVDLDETMTDSHSVDNNPLQMNRLSQIIPTPKTMAFSGDLTSLINKKVPILMNEQQSSSELLYTSIVKYLYDAV